MRAWISSATGEIYYGRRLEMNDKSLPDRPSAEHIWKDSAWTIPLEAVDVQEERAVSVLPDFIIEILFQAENDRRQLRRNINQLAPATYSPQESAAVTRPQYHSALKRIWRALNPLTKGQT